VGKEGGGGTNPLLSQLTSTFVLAVAQEFDDAALVGCESFRKKRLAPWGKSPNGDSDLHAGRIDNDNVGCDACKNGIEEILIVERKDMKYAAADLLGLCSYRKD